MPLLPAIIAMIAGKAFDQIVKSGRAQVKQSGGAPVETMVSKSELATAMKEVVQVDPQLINQLNAEPLRNSRVAVGATAATIASLGIVITEIGQHGFKLHQYNWGTFGPALAALLASAYALYGRVKSGLEPIRWFGWFRGK